MFCCRQKIQVIGSLQSKPLTCSNLCCFGDDLHQRDARHSRFTVKTEETQRLRINFVVRCYNRANQFCRKLVCQMPHVHTPVTTEVLGHQRNLAEREISPLNLLHKKRTQCVQCSRTNRNTKYLHTTSVQETRTRHADTYEAEATFVSISALVQ